MIESCFYQCFIQDFYFIQIFGLLLNVNNEVFVGGFNVFYEIIDGKGYLFEIFFNFFNGLVVEVVYLGLGIVCVFDDQDVFEDVVEF